MASQELLGSSNDVSNDDGRAEREQDVLVVWVQNQTVVYLSCRDGLEREIKRGNKGEEKAYLKIR